MTENPTDPLAECEKTLEQLKEQNAELRQSSESFGELAERLNQQNRALGAPSAPIECPRCRRALAVEGTPPTPPSELHCTYCGNTWRSETGI